jgi:hypothetical protein
MRTCTIAFIAVSILMWTAWGKALAAPPAATATSQSAPIGHRQPNASNVPPSVLDAEQKRNAEDIELDKRLNICRGC